MIDSEKAYLFRAKVGTEEGWLVKSFNWTGLLKFQSGVVHLLVLSKRLNSRRSLSILMVAGLVPPFAILASWQQINSYFSTIMSAQNYVTWVYSMVAIFLFVIWPLGTIGLIYFLDFLTIGVQSRHAYDAAVIGIKTVHIGRLRHTLDVVIEKDFVTARFPKESLLTIAATRKGLRKALASLQS